jgi:hypothetical protein
MSSRGLFRRVSPIRTFIPAMPSLALLAIILPSPAWGVEAAASPETEAAAAPQPSATPKAEPSPATPAAAPKEPAPSVSPAPTPKPGDSPPPLWDLLGTRSLKDMKDKATPAAKADDLDSIRGPVAGPITDEATGPAPRGDDWQGGFVAGQSKEIESERAIDAKVFLNPDGTRSAKVYAEPIHFADQSGKLKEIDNTIVPFEDGFRNAAGPQVTTFAGSADSAEVVTVSGSGQAVSFSMPGALPVAPQIQGSRITYPGVFEGIDLTYIVESDSVKELVVLNAPPAAGTDTSFRFELKPGDLTPRKTEAGGIDIADAKGQVHYRIPPAYAVDSNPVPGPSSLGHRQLRAGRRRQRQNRKRQPRRYRRVHLRLHRQPPSDQDPDRPVGGGIWLCVRPLRQPDH